MSYRNKTFISFASEDINYYRIMEAWRVNTHIDFDFFDAHDFNVARDSSQPETIRRRLRERLANTKQVVMLIGDVTRSKATDPASFIHYEAAVIPSLGIPVVLANLNGRRDPQMWRVPDPIHSCYTVSVSFNARIIKYALDHFPAEYDQHARQRIQSGEHQRMYLRTHYESLGLGLA